MLRRLRENGPVVLVPLAWTFAIAAHVDLLETRTVLIAHLVMDAVLVAFTVASWGDMREGVLLAWRRVLVAGLGVTLLGTAGLLQDPLHTGLLFVTVLGWLVIPAAGLAYTATKVEVYPWAYGVGAGLSAAGAVGYAAGVFLPSEPLVIASLALAGAGQTKGIVAAVVAY
jgi:hypothetical protein